MKRIIKARIYAGSSTLFIANNHKVTRQHWYLRSTAHKLVLASNKIT